MSGTQVNPANSPKVNIRLSSLETITQKEYNLKAWFGDSKVVDAQGRPLVVYHGTSADITTFKNENLGTATGAKSAQQGHFFVADPGVAVSYAHHAATGAKVQQAMAKADALEIKAQLTSKQADWDAVDKAVEEHEALEGEVAVERLRGQNVLPVYLAIRNPMTYDANGQAFTDISDEINKVLQDAKRAGHDGVILRNLDDDPGFNGRVADHFVVFEPTQIKSAIGNSGLYLRDSSSLTDHGAVLTLANAGAAKSHIDGVLSCELRSKVKKVKP